MNRTNESKPVADLKRAILDADLTQAWAARKLSVNAGYLGSILNGKLVASNELLQRMKALAEQIKASGLGKQVS